jgi:hypothetical protein
MTAVYFPMTLTDGLLVDGEAAQLLSIQNAVFAPITQAVPTSPARPGKMKLSFLLKWAGGADTNTGNLTPNDVITLRVRSPYAGDVGEQNHRPMVTLTFVTPTSFMSAAPVDGLPAAVPPVVAADFSPLFNAKEIPNWGVVLTALGPSELEAGVYVEIDFSHTIAS